jgi:WD40 repeat protein
MKSITVALILLILCGAIQPAAAQQPPATVIQRLVIDAPPGYVDDRVVWSPDGSLIAVNFDIQDGSRRPIERLWQIYDVKTTEKLHEIVVTATGYDLSYESNFIWYADSTRLLVRPNAETPAQIIDARTGERLATLEDAGFEYLRVYDFWTNPQNFPTLDFIFNRDDDETLRVYDPQSGALRLMRPHVPEMPAFSPDNSQFAITVEGAGVEVYDEANLTLLYDLPDYRVGKNAEGNWSPDGSQLIVVPQSSVHRYFGPHHIWTLGGELSVPIYNITGRISWSPDGTRIVAPIDYTRTRIFNAQTGELVRSISGLGRNINGYTWQDNYLFVESGRPCCYNNYPQQELTIWDFEYAQILFYTDVVGLNATYELKDDILEITENWGSTRQINIYTGRTVYESKYDVSYPRFSPDKRWYIDNGTHWEEGVPVWISVYETDTQQLIAKVSGHTEIVNVFWSPDSRHFASVGPPNRAIIWKISEGIG